MSAILVTGGTGTLGRALVPRLAAAGHQVTVRSRRPRPAKAGPERWATGNISIAGIDRVPFAYYRAKLAVLPVPLPGAAAAAFRRGGHLAQEHAAGRVTFQEFLAGRFGASRPSGERVRSGRAGRR